jgi:hypothetical protein
MISISENFLVESEWLFLQNKIYSFLTQGICIYVGHSVLNFVDRIYLIELEIKDTTDTDRYVSYLDLHLEIDSEGRLRTKLYDKRDDFNFPIVNFPFICSNIPAEPAYGLYICQLLQTW